MNNKKGIKYDIGDKLFYYNICHEICIIKIQIIVKDCDGIKYLPVNWCSYLGEDEIYTDYDECFHDAVIRLENYLFEDGWRNSWSKEEISRVYNLFNRLKRRLDEQRRPE